MIGAVEDACVASTMRNFHAPMRAHIVEGMEIVIARPRDNDGLTSDPHRHVVARFRDLFYAADTQPVLHETSCDFALEDIPNSRSRRAHGPPWRACSGWTRSRPSEPKETQSSRT